LERNGKYLIVFILLLTLITLFPVYTQDYSKPEWILYRKGINLYNSKNFSEAFNYFREASRKRDFPEAEYYIGRIFENEGEQTLALKQYERAESFKDSLFTETFYNKIIIQKAEIYRDLNKHNLYQETLASLIKRLAEEKRISRYMSLLPERIVKTGLDKLFFYYRLDGDEIIYPCGELGVYYFSLSQDNNVIRYLTPSVTAIMSKIFLIFRDYDPEYAYNNLEKFLSDAENSENTGKYLESSYFYKYLFYLSLSLHNTGETDEAYRLLNIISRSRFSGKYRDISERIVINRNSDIYIEKVKESLLLTVE